MAPILIDSRDLIKFGFISVLTAFSVFSAGFLFGHQQAESFYLTGNKIESLSLPEKVVGIEGDLEPQMPGIIDAGEEVDVDQPELLANEVVQSVAVNKTSSEIEDTESHDLAVSVDSKSTADKLSVTNHGISDKRDSSQAENIDTAVNEISEENTSENIINADTDKDVVQKYQAVVVSSFTSDELNKIKYSIQVGMYGRLLNAENMMETLQAKQLNAYVSDYKNNKDEVRYNVRFGYFVDKKTAVSALEAYKDNQDGDGYLVRFSVENITNLARAEGADQPALIEEDSQDSQTPESKPSDVIQDQVAPVDTINTTNVSLETHAEILAKTQIETRAN